MNPVTPIQKILTRAAVFLLVVFLMAGTAFAADQPPGTAPQQRAWLINHLIMDMQGTGSFPSGDIAQTVSLVNAVDDGQVSLLAQYYCLTRERTELDVQLYAVQQTGGEEALARAQADVADRLIRLQHGIEQAYYELATTGPVCQMLCQIVYACIPGWCVCNQYAIPDSYYGDGCYVGPVYSAEYSGAYAFPVYTVFRPSRNNWWNSRNAFHPSHERSRNGVPLKPVVIAPHSHYPETKQTPHAVAPHMNPNLRDPVHVAVPPQPWVQTHAAPHQQQVAHEHSGQRADADSGRTRK